MELAASLPKVLVIVGPTASGKTHLSLEIARLINSEVISADSRQVYKLLDIGTSKPTLEEMAKVKHHFVDRLMPDEHFSAGEFGMMGRQTIREITGRGKLPMVVGGTGLYVRALIDGLFVGPGREKGLRDELESRLASQGSTSLLEELRRIDPSAAQRMLPSNARRIIRALEVYYATGQPISKFHREHGAKREFDAIFVGLEWERRKLYERINHRVDQMLAAGFLEEVRGLLSKGYDDRFKSLQTVGYKEAFAYFRKEIDLDRMVELMKQNTRRYAKRQLTWFRKEARLKWFSVETEEELTRIARTVAESVGPL